MHRNDDELVQDALEGVKGSFEELVHRYTTQIYNFAYRLTGSTEYAEDITQETFIKVWKNLNRYNPTYSFKSWIFTIARNTSTDFLRKKKSILFSNMNMPEDMSFDETIADTVDLPSEALAKIEDTEALSHILKQLPLDYQTVILLHYQNDLTFEEIGKTMKKPLNTVKSWHRRALIKLRDLLG